MVTCVYSCYSTEEAFLFLLQHINWEFPKYLSTTSFLNSNSFSKLFISSHILLDVVKRYQTTISTFHLDVYLVKQPTVSFTNSSFCKILGYK
jgi:hypothetical protein